MVEWIKPKARPAWMSVELARLPETIPVRELPYNVGRPGFRTRTVTLVTTLLDAEACPLEALDGLYGTRWKVGEYLRDLEQSLKMDVLRCKTVDGVLKELMVHAIESDLVRLVMGAAARRQRVAVDRISFVDALRWLRDAKPGEAMPRLVVNPTRPGRADPSLGSGSGVPSRIPG